MTDAERAYQAAEEAIETARESGASRLDFDEERFHALVAVPPAIEELSGLKELDLSNTQVADIPPLADPAALQGLYLNDTRVSDTAPLAGFTALYALDLTNTQVADATPLATLAALRFLYLNNTRVADAAPLASLTTLERLDLDNTQVADLRPIRGLRGLEEGAKGIFGGLLFKNCAATRLDPDGLGALAEIEDDEVRTRLALDYLAALTEWPPPKTGPAPVDLTPEAPPRRKALLRRCEAWWRRMFARP